MGDEGPGLEVIQRDFPDIDLLVDDPGHDGQHFYVLARALPHLTEAEGDLGFRPGYRAQRIGVPLVARALHPWGGGGGSLVVALLLANALGIFAGAIAISMFVNERGGPAWVGAIFPWIPACLQGLQITLVDACAAGLGMAALAAASRRRPVASFALALLALLTKEATVVLFAGWVLWALVQRVPARRWLPLVAATGPILVWFLLLRRMFPGPRLQGEEFVPPLSGLVGAVQATLDGVAGATTVGLGTSLLVFAGLVLVAIFGDHRQPWPWVALTLAVYQSLFTDFFWYRTINAQRFTVAGTAVLLVVLGLRYGADRARSPVAAA